MSVVSAEKSNEQKSAAAPKQFGQSAAAKGSGGGTKPTAKPAPAQKSGSSPWIPGIVGGMLGAGAVGLGPMVMSEPEPDPRIVSQIGAIEAQIGEIEGMLTERINQLSSTAETLATDTAALNEVTSALTPGLETLEGSLQEITGRIIALEERPVPISDPSRAAAIEDRLANAESTLGAFETDLSDIDEKIAAETGRLNVLAERVNGLEAEMQRGLESVTNDLRAGLEEAQGAIGSTETALTALSSTVATGLSNLESLTGTTAEQDKMLSAQIEGVTSNLETVGGEVTTLRSEFGSFQESVTAATSEIGDTLASIGGRIDALELVGERGAYLTLALDDLEKAIESGADPSEPVARLTELSAGDEALEAAVSALAAATGEPVATIPELTAGLHGLQPTGTELKAQGQPEGVLDTALYNLSELIGVRALDDASLARSEAIDEAKASLAVGDVAVARAIIGRLEAGDDEALAEWLAAADRRIAVENAIAGMRQRLDEILKSAG